MPGIKDFKKVSSLEPSTAKLQERLQEFFVPFVQSAIIDGQLLTKVILVSGGTNTVEHGLARELRGWIVVRNRANSVVWDTQDSNPLKTKNLLLQCSAPTSVDLWVF